MILNGFLVQFNNTQVLVDPEFDCGCTTPGFLIMFSNTIQTKR